MTLPLLICIAGLIIWFIATRPRFAEGWVAEAGKLSFFAGLLVTLFTYAGMTF